MLRNRLNDLRQLPKSLLGLMGISMGVLFCFSSLRHALFQSNAWDLGIFDQPLYLLSRGLPPISTIVNVHILGDHAAWIFYPLAGLYWIYPDVHWLFAVQAIALALGALPTWCLGRQAGLKDSQAIAIAVAYLLYPLIFNFNLFDFHPEAIALPLILTAVWMARADRPIGFVLCVLVILGCRDALSLTVAGMGIWLGVFEKKWICGAIAAGAGLLWFIVATQVIIPHFQPAGVLGTSYYAAFGNSIPEIALNLLLRPDLVLRQVITLENVGYLCLLLAPLAWGLHPACFAPLVAALPQLLMNLLSDHAVQKDLVHQYSLPILPFLLLAVIAAIAVGKSWLHRPRWIVLWSLAGFLAFGQIYLFGGHYLATLDTWAASRGAIAHITSEGAVLAPAALVPHLSHRPLINIVAGAEGVNLDAFDYLLFNRRHPGRMSTPDTVSALINQTQRDRCFQLTFEQNDVFLFHNHCRQN